MEISKKAGIDLIKHATSVTFLTGAGASTPSGIPDYRSLSGVYHGQERPEYLLSRTALLREPAAFYEFVKRLYHPEAKPNVIHQTMHTLATTQQVQIVTQNIDQLHRQAGSSQLVEFHGTLYRCSCLACGQAVSWQAYLKSDRHLHCGGQLRPEIVLYEEGFADEVIQQALAYTAAADLIVIVGTSFQVAPFNQLTESVPATPVLVINQEPIYLSRPYSLVLGDAAEFFQLLEETL